MELNVINKRIVVQPISNIITQGENNVDKATIILSQFYDDIDLSSYTFIIRGVSRQNTIAQQILQKTIKDNSIYLDWMITSDFTAIDGLLSLEVVGQNADGEQIIKLTADDIFIQPNLKEDVIPPPTDIYEQLQESILKAVAIANKALDESGKMEQYSSYLLFPNVGKAVNTYVDTTTNKIYRFDEIEWIYKPINNFDVIDAGNANT